MPFEHALARLTIGSLDDANLTVTAHYNPAELNTKKAVTWEAHAEAGTPTKKTKSVQDSHAFKGGGTRSMSLELLFDGYEDDESIEPIVQTLEQLSNVRNPESRDPEMRRPHFCVVAFGDDIRAFRCVITSLAVKYTMFGKDGTALRATCAIELQEANLKSGGALRGTGVKVAQAFGQSLGSLAASILGD